MHKIIIHPAWFLLALPFLFGLIMLYLSFASGWMDLAQKYRAPQAFKGPWAFTGGVLGDVRYAGTLAYAVTPEGLHLRTCPWPLFALGHAPLFIPWDAFSEIGVRQEWLQGVVVFKFKQLAGFTLTVAVDPQRLYEVVPPAVLQEHFPPPAGK